MSSSSHHNFQQRGDGGCISIEQQAPNHIQVRPQSSNIITYAVSAQNHPNLLHETHKRQIKTKDNQQAATGTILDQKLAANFNFNQIAGKEKLKTTGKPPKAMNQSMQHHGQVIATETDHLDRSLDSISNVGQSQQNLAKHMFNIASSTTLRSCFGTIMMDHQQALQPPQLSSKMQILHQEGTVTSTKQTPAQGDANIKGRKMDTPHLVVVKELKEQEDLDELSQIRAKGAHLMPRRSRIQEEILVNMSFLNNSGLLGQKHGPADQENSHAKQRESRAKSQENQYNKGRNKSKERGLAIQNQAFNHIKQPQVQALKIEDQSKIQSHVKKSAQSLQHIQNQRKGHQNHQGGTKSSREGAKTSLSNFNELIVNNNNKVNGEVASSTNQQQQQSILNNDFKNRTHHEILIQTQPRQFQKAPANNNEQQQSRSRSREKKANQVKGGIQAVLPKSLGSHNRARNYPYPHHEPRKTSTSHAHTDASADKKSSQFIIANEHGRCVTSQGKHQTLSLNSNGRTQSQPSLVKTKGFRQGAHQGIQESDVLVPGATLLTEQTSQNHQISTSPDQHQRQMGALFSQNQLIDMIVKQNMLKMKQDDKVKRQLSEERIKKKKDQPDNTSHIINGRQQQSLNRDRDRDRAGHSKKHHQIVPTLAISTINVNQNSHDNPQQTITNLSSIDYPGANPKLQNFKPNQKWNLKQIKKLNIQKLSQSQRLDFQLLNDQKNAQIKQQAVSSKIQAQLQQHRKSYGLEFIDIKKEIQREEMKTLVQKLYQHKDSADLNTSQQPQYKHSHYQHFDHDEEEEQQVPRRLKIKQSSKQGGRIQQDTDQLTNSSQYLDTSSNGCQGHQNMRTERGGSDEQQPSVILDHSNNLAFNNPPHIEANTSKVLVIKKSKIRKFMKMKKREKQKEMHLQQQSEILKTIKMQENITKLNEFCKKNLQKQLVHKKRNTVTLQQQQQQQPDLKSQMIVNLTKISGRRLNFEQQDHHNQASHNLNGGGQDESSCLSTEFYEEYYQAMKALKGGNQIGQSRQVHHSPTSKSLNHPTRSQNHQNTLIVSPKQDDRSANKDDNKGKIAKQHKATMQHSVNVAVLKNQQKNKKPKTTTSKGRVAVSGQNHPSQHINLQISDHQQTLINNLISKGKHGGRSGNRERSESAPLYKNHHRKPPTSTANINQSSSRLNNTTLNDSSINNKKNTLNLSSSQNKDRKITLVVNTDSGSSSKKEEGMSSIEQELLQIYLQNRQKQNLQKSESDPSTVQRINQDHHSSSQQILLTDRNQEEGVDTVRHEEDGQEYQDKRQQPPTLDYLLTDAEILEDNSCSIPQDTITHIPYLKGEYDDEVDEDEDEEDDEDDEEDEEEEEETDNQLIIINQDPFMDDDKKIVYLSNINSCSLPQTPKQDPSSCDSQINAETKPVIVHPPIQNTFEYIAKKNGLILEQVQYDNQFNEKIESPMIIEEEEEKNDTERSVIQNPPSLNQEDYNNIQMMASEQKIMDYQMRLFTGSESVVREIKLSTPRDFNNFGNVFNELMQTGAKGASGNKQRTLTAQHSEQSLITVQTHTRQVVQDADLGLQHQTTNTTSSHQSLFDRNSFQHFTAQKLQDMIRNNEFLNLISMRERALDFRQEKEKRYIKKLYKARQMSPRTYTQRKEQLEKWVRLEQNDIHQTKAKYQEEWDKAIQMIEETQKNVVLMREQIFTHQDAHHIASAHNHRQIKQGEFGGFQSSRNSTASLYATQQSCHKGNERKSILEQEEYQPISHRSNRLLLSAQKPSHLGPTDIPLKTTLHTLVESTINYDQQTKPSFQVAIDDPMNTKKKQDGAGNLIDFLEESWKKSQISIQPAATSNLSNRDNGNKIEVEGGNRIFIQDQNNSSSALESSQKGESHSSDLIEKEESPLALKNASDNQSSNERSIFIDNKVLVESSDLNRPLARSRSQQDLTEQLKKSRFEIDRDNLLAQSEYPKDLEEYDSINKDEESFRLMESEHQQNQNSQIVLIRKTQGNDEIKIQENLFEGSSQHQVSLKQNPQHHITSSLNSGLLLQPEESELHSQDSLLNEQELNHYFNLDAQKKFSIEDFKQLDKRQLLSKNKIECESEASHFDIYDDDDELQSSRSNKAKNHQGLFRDQYNGVEDGILAEEKQITQESNVSISLEDHKSNSQRIDDAKMIVSSYLMNNHSEPELIMNQPPQTSSFLFQNAKPGENIKIADILRKNSLGKENNGQQLMNMFSIAEVVSQPEIIHQESFDSFQEREQIAFEIAEDILRMLIDEQVQMPSDFYVKQRPLFNNNEQSPEYSLIVPYRIVENDSNGTLPFSTKEDELQTNPNQIPMFSNFDALELDDIKVETKPQQQLQTHLVPSPQNQQNQDVYQIDTSFNEKEQRRELIDFRQRILIESDLQRIENYINEIINTLQQHELNYLEGLSGQPHLLNDPNFHRQFLQVLTVPIKRSQLDVLNQLQTSEIGSYEHFETTMDITSHPILPVDLYLDIERQREELSIKMLSNHINGEQDIENSVIQESLHIHNKAIFDALNESLMKFRPYGIQGEPMPWSNKIRRLQTKVDTSQVDTERLFYMVKQDVMRWTSNCVGCLPSQIFIVRRQLPPNPMIQPPTDQFDDEIFQETRERRLASMLTSEVVETEHQWLNYEFEESQVKIDLSDMILEHLVDEVVQCLNNQKFQQQVRQQQNLNFEIVPSTEFEDGFDY